MKVFVFFFSVVVGSCLGAGAISAFILVTDVKPRLEQAEQTRAAVQKLCEWKEQELHEATDYMHDLPMDCETLELF